MTIYIRKSLLSVGGLSLSIFNDEGQPQDTMCVNWTITSSHDGKRVSGIRMNAIRIGVGRYYAPWHTDFQTGSFEITWEYQKGPSYSVEKKTDKFFIVDLDDSVKNNKIKNLPPPGGKIFQSGYRITGYDVVLYIKNNDDILSDGYDVEWIIERKNCTSITLWRKAIKLSTGVYGIDWTVNVPGGEYNVKWRFSEKLGGPLQEVKDKIITVSLECPKNGAEIVGYKPGG